MMQGDDGTVSRRLVRRCTAVAPSLPSPCALPWPVRLAGDLTESAAIPLSSGNRRSAASSPRGAIPRSFTLTFPPFEAPDYDRAVALARASAEYRETGSGDSFRHRARFYPQDAGALKDLFEIIGRYDTAEVLVDDRPVPFARELWLPLLWILTLRVPV